MKKLLLSIGAVVAVASPVGMVVACSSDSPVLMYSGEKDKDTFVNQLITNDGRAEYSSFNTVLYYESKVDMFEHVSDDIFLNGYKGDKVYVIEFDVKQYLADLSKGITTPEKFAMGGFKGTEREFTNLEDKYRDSNGVSGVVILGRYREDDDPDLYFVNLQDKFDPVKDTSIDMFAWDLKNKLEMYN